MNEEYQALIESLESPGSHGLQGEPSAEELPRLMGATMLAYLRLVPDQHGEAIGPLPDDFPTTEAMEIVTRILRQQHMNPFDLALWFSRSTADN